VRYYFHIIEGSCEIADPEGTDLPGQDAAQAEALAIAAELAREFPDRFRQNSVLEVVCEDGRRIMAFLIRSAIFDSVQAA